MARSDRLFQLIQCLRTLRSPIRAEQLADELGVSLRTIYRDIDALRLAGALIDGAAGYGYTLKEDPELPPMMFNHDEMEAIVLGLREVREVGDPVLAKAASNALSKLKASLPDRMRTELEHAVLYAKRFGERPDILIDIRLLRSAAREETEIKISYVDQANNATERRAFPLAIVYLEQTLVLLAWCGLRDDYRSFRIDRIQELQSTGCSFRPRRVSMLREYLSMLQDDGKK